MSYKIYIIIEDTDTCDEEAMPLGIAERERFDEAVAIRERINLQFGEINPPMP